MRVTLDRLRLLTLACAVSAVSVAWVAPSVSLADTVTKAPGWELTSRTFPTNLAPGGKGTLVVDVNNVGAERSSGVITVTDTLPSGVTAIEAGELKVVNAEAPELGHELWSCTGDGSGGSPGVEGAKRVTCTNQPSKFHFAGGAGAVEVAGYGGFGSFENPHGENNFVPEIGIAVQADASESTGTNHVVIAGGGAATSASTSTPVTVSSNSASFGFTNWDGWFSNSDGTVDTQAGSHPYEATLSWDLATFVKEEGSFQDSFQDFPSGGEVRNLEVELPPGFVGDPTAAPQCTRQELNGGRCPNASQIGTLSIFFAGGSEFLRERLFNMVPPPGVPAEFAITVANINTYFDTALRSGSDYGLTTHVNNIPQREIVHVVTTIWGEPADPSHVIWRTKSEGGCTQQEIENTETKFEGKCKPAGGDPVPFLTLPTSCGAPLKFTVRADTWQHPEDYAESSFYWHDTNDLPVGLDSCEALQFAPGLTSAPDTGAADTPTGLTVDVKPAVGGLTDPNGVGTSDIENTTVTLPEGLAINPGQAAGLEACQESEAHIHVEDVAPECPLKSKVGTVEAATPILKAALKGNVYVLQSNPPNLRLLVTASGEGVEIKLPLGVHLNEHTGQLVSTLEGSPQAPVSDFKLSFSGGAQAALATPTHCGVYTTTSDFSPWASPFIADSFPTAAFAVTSGTGGAPCPPSVLPFSPELIAGSTTDQAGGFTDFSMLLRSADDQQRVEKLQFKVPSGLLGMISQVPLCQEPQAQAGTCSSASQIGHTTVASGPGPYPLVVPQPGQPQAPIYLTGPYKGAPYGLSIVVPVHVGPFTLPTQVVRARIDVDPLTAQITVTTDPLPQVIAGVPTDLRTVDAVIDREGFMFNPTNCSPMSFSGTAWGTPPPGTGGPGSTASISSPFQMGSCRALLFKPNFEVSTSGKTSRKNGASLDAKIVYPRGPLGANQASSQSNLRSVKVDLPKQLPSRLTTLQKACTSKVFEANPANCPADSRVGSASAVTPVLPVTLTGPAYFVSYGGAKFPELVFALQGYGVTIYVHGETFINKAGITSSTFHQVPDVPIYQFELKLPEGPFSALAANGNLCNTKLKMPTAFTAQDGAQIKQSTPITVTGCAKKKVNKSKSRSSKRQTAKTHGKKR
jgi:uncharacterized repeat protein (TIGR01451 family)